MPMRGLRKLFFDERNSESMHRTTEEGVRLADIIESGDFQINLAQRTATLCGQELQLTSEEFDVLVFLARHPQRLVTPHTMLATNWTGNGRRETEFLKVLLSLRNKLEAAGTGKHYLRTEPWVIYRFDTTSTTAEGTQEPRETSSDAVRQIGY